MQVDAHVVEFTRNSVVSCDGTVPVSWLLPSLKLPVLTRGEDDIQQEAKEDRCPHSCRTASCRQYVRRHRNCHYTYPMRVSADSVDGTLPDNMFELMSSNVSNVN